MSQNTQDRKVVYCLPERSHLDDKQGLLKPIFEETVDGIVLANHDNYKNNGYIHVTKGYDQFFKPSLGKKFIKVTANISNTWTESTHDKNMSKYVTYDKNMS